jgi:hypothetical protein
LESSNNESFKLDYLPSKKELTATYDNRNLINHVHLDQPTDELDNFSNSVYLKYHTNETGNVDS